MPILQKKVPVRMCVGCAQHKPKKELIRIVKNAQSEISLDLTGKQNGRGAYLCNCVDCLKKAQKNRRIERVFASKIPDEVYDFLEKEMTNAES